MKIVWKYSMPITSSVPKYLKEQPLKCNLKEQKLKCKPLLAYKIIIAKPI